MTASARRHTFTGSELGVAALLAIHLALSAVSVWALSAWFYRSHRVVLLHSCLAAGLIALFVGMVAFGLHRRWVANTRPTRVALSLIMAIAVTLQLMLYGGNAVGNTFWGNNLNLQLASQYAAAILPNRPPFFVSAWIYVPVAALVLTLFAAYSAVANVVVSTIERYVMRETTTSRKSGRWIAVAAAVFVSYAGTIGLLASELQKRGLINREPFVGFFLKTDNVLDFTEYAVEREVAAREATVRSSYPHGLSFNRRNVILITVDSLRADHTSAYGYHRPTTPFLDRLLAEGHLRRVRMALSTCSESVCGIMSTLMSKPLRHLVPGSFSMADLLHDQGYAVYQIFSGNSDYSGLREALGHEQTLYFDSASSRQFPINDDGVLFEGLARLPDHPAAPIFLQLHLMSAHALGVRHERYRIFQPSTYEPDFEWLLDKDLDPVRVSNHYDNGVVEADATLERLFDELRRKGYLRDSIVVILADHGEALGDRGPSDRGHRERLYQESLSIPLFIYDDPEVAYSDLSFATQIDVAPTIVDRLGLPIPASWEGRSILSGSSARFSFHQTNRFHACYAVFDRTEGEIYKYLRCRADGGEEVYELVNDPGERKNLAEVVAPALILELRDKLNEYLGLRTAIEPDRETR